MCVSVCSVCVSECVHSVCVCQVTRVSVYVCERLCERDSVCVCVC